MTADRPTTEPRTEDQAWLAGYAEGVKRGRAIEAEAAQGSAPRAEGLVREAAAATPSLPDEWLLSISIMEAARRIDVEMSVGHSWRELAMLTNAILADQYRVARLDKGSATPDNLSDLSLSSVSAEGSATPDQGKGEPR